MPEQQEIKWDQESISATVDTWPENAPPHPFRATGFMVDPGALQEFKRRYPGLYTELIVPCMEKE